MTTQDDEDFGPELAKYEDMAFQQLDSHGDKLLKQLNQANYPGEETKVEVSK